MIREAPQPVGDLLARAVPQLADRLLVERVGRRWASIVGADVARRTRPRSLAHGTLEIVVDNSPWLHELTLRSAELERRLRAEVPDVRGVRLVLGSLTDGAPDALSAPMPRRAPVPLEAKDLTEIDEILSPISDPALAATVRRVLTTARRFPIPRGGV